MAMQSARQGCVLLVTVEYIAAVKCLDDYNKRDFWFSSVPVVNCDVSGLSASTTPCAQQSSVKVINEVLSFEIAGRPPQLIVSVGNDAGGESFGAAQVDLNNLHAKGEDHQWLQLQPLGKAKQRVKCILSIGLRKVEPARRQQELNERTQSRQRGDHRRQLVITVEKARGLKNMDFMKKMDPYVLAVVGKMSARTHTIPKGGPDPDWLTTLEFGEVTDDDEVVNFLIYDEDLTEDEMVGVARVPLAKARQDLNDQQSLLVFRPSGKVKGSLNVRLTMRIV